MMKFEFITAGKIIFERGAFGRIGSVLRAYGEHFLAVVNHGFSHSDMIALLKESAAEQGVRVTVFDGVRGEPSPETVANGLEMALAVGADGVVGIGGGTALDTAKAVAGLIYSGGPVTDYLEGVGIGRQIETGTAPFIAVPITAGTGAEVTKNAVISSMSEGYKKSFRSEKLLAKVVVVDPLLTVGVSPRRTAYSGMDALTQLIESYVSVKATPFTDGLCEKGIRYGAASLLPAYRNGEDVTAREGMCFASLLSGICLANSGLGAAHGFAAGLGAVLGIEHGQACAILLPHVMACNLSNALSKYAFLGRVLTGEDIPDDRAAAEAGVAKVKEMNKEMGIAPDLKHLNITQEQLERIIHASFGSSMSGNPKAMDYEQCKAFLLPLI